MRRREMTAGGRTNPLCETLEGRRLLSAGQLDPTFGDGGKVLTDRGMNWTHAVAVQADGKIVALAGDDRLGAAVHLARYNADGSLDTSFGGGDGVVATNLGFDSADGYDLALLPGGKIAVAGRSMRGDDPFYFAAEFNADGSPDGGFGDGGVVSFAASTPPPPAGVGAWMSMSGPVQTAAQADGKLVLAMTQPTAWDDADLKVVRLDAAGDLDATFGAGGVVTRDLGGSVEYAADLVVDGQGRIALAVDAAGFRDLPEGRTLLSTQEYVLRLNADGSADGSFGNGGAVSERAKGLTINGYDLAVDDQGRLLLVGETMTPDRRVTNTLTRFEADGDRDMTFGANGRVVLVKGDDNGANFGDVLPLSDGKVLVSGGSVEAGRTGDDGNMGLSLRRLNADGSIDATYGAGGTVRYTFDGTRQSGAGAMALDAGGDVIVGGRASDHLGKGNVAIVRVEGEGGAAAAGVKRAVKAHKHKKVKAPAKHKVKHKAKHAADAPAAKRAAAIAPPVATTSQAFGLRTVTADDVLGA